MEKRELKCAPEEYNRPQKNIRLGLSFAIQASEEDLNLFAQISGLTIKMLFDIPTLND